MGGGMEVEEEEHGRQEHSCSDKDGDEPSRHGEWIREGVSMASTGQLQVRHLSLVKQICGTLCHGDDYGMLWANKQKRHCYEY